MSEWIATLKGVAQMAWSYPGVQFITVGVILNLGLAWAAAVRNDNFTFREVGAFLHRQLLPYVGVYFIAALTTEGTEWGWIPAAVMVVITAAIGSRIVEHLRDLGIPIPDGVIKLTAAPKQYLVVRKAVMNHDTN